MKGLREGGAASARKPRKQDGHSVIAEQSFFSTADIGAFMGKCVVFRMGPAMICCCCCSCCCCCVSFLAWPATPPPHLDVAEVQVPDERPLLVDAHPEAARRPAAHLGTAGPGSHSEAAASADGLWRVGLHSEIPMV